MTEIDLQFPSGVFNQNLMLNVKLMNGVQPIKIVLQWFVCVVCHFVLAWGLGSVPWCYLILHHYAFMTIFVFTCMVSRFHQITHCLRSIFTGLNGYIFKSPAGVFAI